MDASVLHDLPRGIGDLSQSRCGAVFDANTLAIYGFDPPRAPARFDGGRQGVPDGELVSSGQTGAAFVPGREGCGDALWVPLTKFGEAAKDYGWVPASSAWRLARGAVDLWVRFDGDPTDVVQGIVSRDAFGTDTPGHLTLVRGGDRRLGVRWQGKNNSTGHWVCSEPLSKGVWYHVGVNFGAPALALYVDGLRVSASGELVERIGHTLTHTCGDGASAGGIDGNDQPWVIGASARGAATGEAAPAEDGLGGRLDNLRFSDCRRAFSPGSLNPPCE